MKKHLLPISFFLIVLLPYILTSLTVSERRDQQFTEETFYTASDTKQEILLKDLNSVRKLDMEAYVTGVLLGEMPADFELEALKAQAVATRTYTLRKVLNQNKHEDADVCTDPSCCQAFIDETVYDGSSQDVRKIKQAVRDTAGQVLTYQGSLIEATYFSSSGGTTEDAVAVWGTSVPYLRSVKSPEEEDMVKSQREFRFSKQEFLSALGLSDPAVLHENIDVTYTSGEGVDKLYIGDKVFTGLQLRSVFELPSTVFTLTIGDEVVITTRGHGHRVGMSQYGAEAMAVSGSTYVQILSHYYPGTLLETFADTQMQEVFDKEGNL